jgi:hypothetical protein
VYNKPIGCIATGDLVPGPDQQKQQQQQQQQQQRYSEYFSIFKFRLKDL